MSAILSVMGLYNFDSSLFENFHVPASIDKQQLIDDICLECAELEVIYPDFMVLKNAIGIWSSKMLRQWEELVKTLNFNYNPIENYDRYEEYTDTSSGTGRTSNNGSFNRSDNMSNTETSTGSTENFRAGFNSDDLAKTEEQGNDNTVNGSGSTTATGGTTESGTSETTGNLHHVAHLHGNIGVTTAAQMIAEQRDIVRFTVQDVIISDFKKRFCLLIY